MMTPEQYQQVEQACVAAWTPRIRRQAAALGYLPGEIELAIEFAAARGADRVNRMLDAAGATRDTPFSVFIDPDGVEVSE